MEVGHTFRCLKSESSISLSEKAIVPFLLLMVGDSLPCTEDFCNTRSLRIQLAWTLQTLLGINIHLSTLHDANLHGAPNLFRKTLNTPSPSAFFFFFFFFYIRKTNGKISQPMSIYRPKRTLEIHISNKASNITVCSSNANLYCKRAKQKWCWKLFPDG